MKRTALKRGSGLKARTGLAPRCVCNHGKSRHNDGLVGMTYCVACKCDAYRPKRSLSQGAPMPKRGSGNRERNRKLVGMGTSRRDDAVTQEKALLTVKDFLAWLHTQECVVKQMLAGWHYMALAGPAACDGPIEADHIKTRGSYGADIGSTASLCRRHHQMRHAIGLPAFEKATGCPVAIVAKAQGILYEKGKRVPSVTEIPPTLDSLATYCVHRDGCAAQVGGVDRTDDSRCGCGLSSLLQRLSDLTSENTALSGKVAALHRRAQAAEAVAQVTVDECRRQGVSLGRSLANAMATKYEAERDEAWRIAERERDENHRRSCAERGHDAERTSKRLLPWETPFGVSAGGLGDHK